MRNLLAHFGALLSKKTAIPAKPQEFIELLPSGFVTRNYLRYMQNKINGAGQVGDPIAVTRFENGDVIIESAEGHLVLVDGLGRTVVVRISLSACPKARSMDQAALLASVDRGTTLKALDAVEIKRSSTSVSVKLRNAPAVEFVVAPAPIVATTPADKLPVASSLLRAA